MATLVRDVPVAAVCRWLKGPEAVAQFLERYEGAAPLRIVKG